jgi:hypothetical protein
MPEIDTGEGRMRAKNGVTGAGIIVAVLAIASYLSPYWTMFQMKTAIQNKDAEGFSKHVDFPALRESFKGQLSAMMDRKIDAPEAPDNPFAKLGQALAGTLMNRMVDAMVTPTGVLRMMESGVVKPRLPTDADASGTEADRDGKAKYSVTYRNWNEVVARPTKEDAGSFILKRDGLWSWKLSAVEFPATR